MKSSWRWVVAAAIMAAAAALAVPPAGAPVRTGARAAEKPDLADFMKSELNPAFSDVSYYLFQRKGSEAAAKADEAFDRLRTAVNRLEAYQPEGAQDLSSYRIHVVQLQIAARALGDAEPDQRTLWFNQVSAVCNSCHEVYRD